MFNIKSIYFYFLAIQISIIKFIKKIYFTTNFYNKSLLTKPPQQFYFHPNPLLLSIITFYKKFSFKINEIDPNIFWLQSNNNEKKELHNFFWLNLIDRKSDGKSIQKIINLWMLKHSKYKKNIWDNTVLSKRITSWILNADIILNNGFFEFKKNFLTSIILQTNHLKKNIKFENDYTKKTEILVAILLTGLVFKEYKENYNLAIKELEKLVKVFFDNSGFPLNRNPSDLIFCFKYFVLCRECIHDAQMYIPEFLDEIIDKNIICIKNIKTPKDQMPLFNGAKEEDLEHISKYIDKPNLKTKDKKKIIGGIQKIKFKNSCVFFDVGGPPIKNLSRNYQSGPLSIEYHLDGEKIITNCGFGCNISTKAELLSRLTSAQSTLTLNDTSVTRFERNKLVNKIFGNSIKSTFKTINLESSENDDEVKASASHNGYEKNFGCTLKRDISISKHTNNLKGTDEIFVKKDSRTINYNIRFHLYPGLSAVKTMSGNGALIQITKNKSLLLTVVNENVHIEKSIFLGRNKILDSYCITISGSLINLKNKTINWEIKKNIN